MFHLSTQRDMTTTPFPTKLSDSCFSKRKIGQAFSFLSLHLAAGNFATQFAIKFYDNDGRGRENTEKL